MFAFNKAVIVAALGSAAFVATPAAAQVIVNGTTYTSGQSLTLSFNGMSGNTTYTGLRSELFLKFNGWNNTGEYLFDFRFKNSSVGHPFSEATAFGFNTDPVNPDFRVSSEAGPFRGVSSGSIANSHRVEFCVTGGPNCAGGSSTGPDAGETWNGSFVLGFAGNSNPGPITLSNFHTRYQSVTVGRNNNGGSATGNLVGVTSHIPALVSPIPEPATWAMMLVGFGAVGAAMRRRQSGIRKLRSA
jgi:hypothetical protein